MTQPALVIQDRRYHVLQQVVALGSDVGKVKQELEDTVEEELRIVNQIRRVVGLAAPDSSKQPSPGPSPASNNGKSTESQFAKQERFDKSLNSVQRSLPNLNKVLDNANLLGVRLRETRNKADSVSRRVRQLDLARTRALDTLHLVNVKIKIKECMKAVEVAMKQQDYIAAAGHVHTYHQVSQLLHHSPSAAPPGDARPSADASEHGRIMSVFETELRDKVLLQLDQAVETGTEAEVLQFSVVFAKLGLGREGVSRFTQYLRGTIKDEAEMNLEAAPHKTLASFAAAKLLGNLINQAHGVMQNYRAPVLEHFGTDALDGAALIAAVHAEFNHHACKILDLFMSSRKLKQRIGMLQNCKPGAIATTIMQLHGDATAWLNTEPLEALDDLLYQTFQVMQLIVNYDRYVRSETRKVVHRAERKLESAQQQASGKLHEPRRTSRSPTASSIHRGTDPPVVAATVPQEVSALASTTLEYNRKLQDLAGMYVTLESAYLSDAVLMAVEIETLIPMAPSSAAPSSAGGLGDMEQEAYSSSVVDDTFTIVSKCLERSLAIGHVDTANGTISSCITVLEDNVAPLFRGRVNAMISDGQTLTEQGQAHLERLRGTVSLVGSIGAAMPTSNLGTSLLAGGGVGDADAGAALDARVLAVPTTLNSLLECATNVKSVQDLVYQRASENMQDDKETDMLRCRSDDFKEAQNLFGGILAKGVAKLLGTFRDSIRASCKSVFGASDVSYEIGEQQFEQLSGSGASTEPLLATLRDALGPVCRDLAASNCTDLLVETAKYVSKQIEGCVVHKRFSALGGLFLDQQMREVVALFQERLSGKEVRQAFARFSHIVLLLTLTRVEEVYEVQSKSKHLQFTAKEVKLLLELRTDFGRDSIRRLKI